MFRVSSLHAPPISFHSISRIRGFDRSTVVDPFMPFSTSILHAVCTSPLPPRRNVDRNRNDFLFDLVTFLSLLLFSFFRLSSPSPRFEGSSIQDTKCRVEEFSIDDETKPSRFLFVFSSFSFLLIVLEVSEKLHSASDGRRSR